MVRTRAGWIGEQEVVEVLFDPEVTPYARLLEQARGVRKPSTAFVYDPLDLPVARRVVGEDAVLSKAVARPAKPGDRKYHLRRSPYFWLPLTELQASRVNALLADQPPRQDPRQWLSPAQRALLAEIVERLPGRRAQLSGWEPARDPAGFAGYTAALRKALAR